MKVTRRMRVLLAKPGLDGHDRGIKILARELRDAGIEVIYLGLFQPVEAIVSAAIQENVDVIGLSILGGGQLLIAEDLMRVLREKNADNIPVVFGGIISDQDEQVLKEKGVKAVFGPGFKVAGIIEYIKTLSDNESKELISEYR